MKAALIRNNGRNPLLTAGADHAMSRPDLPGEGSIARRDGVNLQAPVQCNAEGYVHVLITFVPPVQARIIATPNLRRLSGRQAYTRYGLNGCMIPVRVTGRR
jgi:hypothetical protein